MSEEFYTIQKMRVRVPGLLLAITVMVLLGWEAFYSVKLAVAERAAGTSTEEGFRHASHLLPSNSYYQVALSEYEAAPSGDTNEGLRGLQRALTLNPREIRAWIDLGFQSEWAGNYAKAEKSFLTAAQFDRQFGPRWQLANYYFRRKEPEKFWHWAYASAEMAQDETARVDLTPLFELCWRVTDDPTAILNRAIPDKPYVQREYLGYLLKENRLNAAQPVAERMVASASREDVDNLLAYEERLLADSVTSSRDLSSALRIWNALANQGLIPYRALRPEQGFALTNGDFAFSPISRGFDWRLWNPPGVYTLWDKSHAQLVVTFSGKEPEKCEILSQFLPLLPAHPYRIKFSYRTRNVAAESGLVCRVSSEAFGAAIGPAAVQLSSEEWKQEAISFSTSPSNGLVQLGLGYQRELGAVRLGLLREASISLRHFVLEQVE